MHIFYEKLNGLELYLRETVLELHLLQVLHEFVLLHLRQILNGFHDFQ